MTKQEVRDRIEEIGIIPAVRVSSVEEAMFAATTVFRGGITVIELTTATPGVTNVISELVRKSPGVVVGVDTVLDLETARACIDAGAAFLTSPGLDLDIASFAAENDILVIPGALTPTEVAAAFKAGMDLIKIFPCSLVGGPNYIRALRNPFPRASFIASGGVTQSTASDFIRAGAAALGIGEDLIPRDAVLKRNSNWILELTRRFTGMVQEARTITNRARKTA
jgi:2-dehydro-3-deoxyphosphogluconate aldolase / (4S)-4-hydroxy-2-oxoglutarate aldolase